MKKYYKNWLESFRKIHNLKTEDEAIEKLIEIHKTWNLRSLDVKT